jgi:thiosulfate/3-mercaptopyruvate sulfurtransferase
MITTEGFAHPEFLVETDALEQRLDDPNLRILDCTTHLIPDPKITYQVVPGRADFEKGHIPGAQFVDLQAISRTRTIGFASCCPPPRHLPWR